MHNKGDTIRCLYGQKRRKGGWVCLKFRSFAGAGSARPSVGEDDPG